MSEHSCTARSMFEDAPVCVLLEGEIMGRLDEKYGVPADVTLCDSSYWITSSSDFEVDGFAETPDREQSVRIHVCGNGRYAAPKQQNTVLLTQLPWEKSLFGNVSARIVLKYAMIPVVVRNFLHPFVKDYMQTPKPKRIVHVTHTLDVVVARCGTVVGSVSDPHVAVMLSVAATVDPSIREQGRGRNWILYIMHSESNARAWTKFVSYGA